MQYTKILIYKKSWRTYFMKSNFKPFKILGSFHHFLYKTHNPLHPENRKEFCKKSSPAELVLDTFSKQSVDSSTEQMIS